MIIERRPWIFRKQLIVFDRLVESIEHSKLHLVMTPLWFKIGPCPPKFDQKDLMHVIGSMFEGLLQCEDKKEYCRIKIQFDVQKQLRKGIFISSREQCKV